MAFEKTKKIKTKKKKLKRNENHQEAILQCNFLNNKAQQILSRFVQNQNKKKTQKKM